MSERRSVSHRKPLRRTVRFRMESARSAVPPAVERVLEAVDPVDLTEEQRHSLAVAVAEALSNAAVHGNRLQPEQLVRVSIAVTPRECATIDVTDAGPGFDVNNLSDPTEPSRVLMPGGRGVFLMRRLVDSLEYNRAGNRVRLTMRREGAKATPRATRPKTRAK